MPSSLLHAEDALCGAVLPVLSLPPHAGAVPPGVASPAVLFALPFRAGAVLPDVASPAVLFLLPLHAGAALCGAALPVLSLLLRAEAALPVRYPVPEVLPLKHSLRKFPAPVLLQSLFPVSPPLPAVLSVLPLPARGE